MDAVLDNGLRDALKALRLTGMLATLDERLAQARDARLGHLEVLQLLLEDELARRQSAALARRLTRARFETTQATLEGFDFTANPKLPTAAIRDLAALRWLTNRESIILYGPVGVGKTHLAQALGHNAIRRGIDVRFTKTSRLLTDLAGGHADRTWDKRLREYTRPGVLILDLSRPRDYPELSVCSGWAAREWARGVGIVTGSRGRPGAGRVGGSGLVSTIEV